MKIHSRWLKLGIALGAALVSSMIPVFGQVSIAPGGYGPAGTPYNNRAQNRYQRELQRGYQRGNNRAQNQQRQNRSQANTRTQRNRRKLPPPPPMKYVPNSNVNPAPAIGIADRVYVAAGSRSVAAYDRKTGHRLWEFQPKGAVTATPAVGPDSTVYFTCYDHDVYALDGKTGAKRAIYWRRPQPLAKMGWCMSVLMTIICMH
jgi:outer membrane protein assembly factor BamB